MKQQKGVVKINEETLVNHHRVFGALGDLTLQLHWNKPRQDGYFPNAI